ncbi:MAG: peptidylprolyl isomerase [Patescibacteria group bacterium]|nr:peptidylprolyl isomerase [Patescibacteria group bacterium]MDD5715093.1 peptidylprolyl isomerase [Patescibacteria group bacterium]
MKNAKKPRIQPENSTRIQNGSVFTQQRRSQGVSDQAIVDELVSNGWSQFDAARIVDGTPTSSANKKPHHWRIAVFMLGFFVIILACIFYWLVIYSNNSKLTNNFNSEIEALKEYLSNSNLNYESNGKDIVVNTNSGSEIIRVAAVVDGATILYSDFISDLATMKYFYSAQSDTVKPPSDVLLSKQILTRLVRQKFLDSAAKQLGITPTSGELDAEYVKLISVVGSSDELETQIKELYNWSTTEFKSKALLPYLTRQKITNYLDNDASFNKTAKEKIETIQKLLSTTTKTFEELADLYGEDIDAKAGGSLGTVIKGQTISEFETAAFALQDGQVSNIVDTAYGYHLIKVLSHSMSSDNVEQIDVKHIFIRKKDVDDWLIEQLKDKVISVYINDFQWKEACGFILSTFETCESNELIQTFSSNFESIDLEALEKSFSNSNTNANTNFPSSATNTASTNQ